jgi:hypothetical protein
MVEIAQREGGDRRRDPNRVGTKRLAPEHWKAQIPILYPTMGNVQQTRFVAMGMGKMLNADEVVPGHKNEKQSKENPRE